MARKITMNGHFRKPLEEVFEDFVISKIAQGVADVTVATYRHHIHSISNHLDIQKPMDTLTRKDLESMVVSMRSSGLAHNTISSYCRVLRTFLPSTALTNSRTPIHWSLVSTLMLPFSLSMPWAWACTPLYPGH